MARVLKADLEKEIQELKNELKRLKDENDKLKFSNDKLEVSHKLAVEQWEYYSNKCYEHEKKIEKLKDESFKYEKDIQKLKNELNEKKKKKVLNVHNERNAGRKPKLTSDEIARAQMLKLQGWSYKKVAEDIGCSVGLVHKLLNEPVGNIKKRDS